MKPVNIYKISRIRNEETFNIIESVESSFSGGSRHKYHEIESLKLLTDRLYEEGVTIREFDGFYFSFNIPQIGKEFDLIKITESTCLNIELKSKEVPKSQILDQLKKNQHYVSHLEKRLIFYTVVTDSMKCYKLSLNGELIECSIGDIVKDVKKMEDNYEEDIFTLFSSSKYLVSPISDPDKFINGEYFLTQAQDLIKRSILSGIDKDSSKLFYHITGRPGTGKTLLIYDLAKTLSKSGKVLLINAYDLLKNQEKISNDIKNFEIWSVSDLKTIDFSRFSFVMVDESHRLSPEQFKAITEEVKKRNQICIFSSDPEQVLTVKEKKNNITGKVKKLSGENEFLLSEKIRMNRELSSFIYYMKDLKRVPKKKKEYRDVTISYANTTKEAQNLIEYYRDKGYTFINYSKKEYGLDPYAEFTEDFDIHHVIGLEFDKVVMLIDKSFYYDDRNILRGIPQINPEVLYPNLFFQGVSRVREKLALIILDAPELLDKMAAIFEGRK